MDIESTIGTDVFISYARSDAAIADEIVSALEKNGFKVKIDRRDLPYGEEWQAELSQFIQSAHSVVWLLSPESVNSKWCAWELVQVQEFSKRVIPVRVKKTPLETIPEQLEKINILPQEDEFELRHHLNYLVDSLKTNRSWLLEHSRIADRAQDWITHGRPKVRLLRGSALSAAEKWRDQRPDKERVSEHILDLVLASRQAAAARLRYGSIALTLLTVCVAGLALFANLQRTVAVEQRDAALTNQSRYLSRLAMAELSKGPTLGGIPQHEYTARAILLATEALSDLPDGTARPYTPAAHSALVSAMSKSRPLTHLGYAGAVDHKYSSDGRWIAARAPNNSLQIISATDYSIVKELKLGNATLTQHRFSDDSKRVGAANEEGLLVIWKIEDGSKVFERTFPDDQISFFTVPDESEDEIFIATSKVLVSLQLDGANEVQATNTSELWVTKKSVGVNKNIAAMFANQQVAIFQSEDSQLMEQHSGVEESAFAWHPFRNEYCYVDRGPKVICKEPGVKKARVTRTLTANGTPYTVAGSSGTGSIQFHPSGSTIWVALGNHVGVLDADSLETKLTIPQQANESQHWFQMFALTNDGSKLITARHDEGYHDGDPIQTETIVWNSSTGRELLRIPESTNNVVKSRVSADGQKLITYSGAVWSLRSEGAKASHLAASTQTVAHDAKMSLSLLISKRTKKLSLVNSREQKKIWESVPFAESTYWKAQFSNDNLWFAVTDGVQASYLGDAGDGKVITFNGRTTAPFIDFDFADESGEIALLGLSGEVLIYNFDTRKISHSLEAPLSGAKAIALSADGKKLALLSDNNNLLLHNLTAKKQQWKVELRGPFIDTAQSVTVTSEEMAFRSVKFSNTGQYVFASSGAHAMAMDASSGAERLRLQGHRCPIRNISLLKDDSLLMTSSNDLPARIWQVDVTGTNITAQGVAQFGFVEGGSPVDVCQRKQSQYATMHADGSVSLYGESATKNYPQLDVTLLLESAKRAVFRCLSTEERDSFSLPSVGPNWCKTRNDG